MALLKVGLPVLQLLVIQVRSYMSHLDVGELRVQVFGIYLCGEERRKIILDRIVL